MPIGGHELAEPVLAAVEVYKVDAQRELRSGNLVTWTVPSAMRTDDSRCQSCCSATIDLGRTVLQHGVVGETPHHTHVRDTGTLP
jgi:hypothetical protein